VSLFQEITCNLRHPMGVFANLFLDTFFREAEGPRRIEQSQLKWREGLLSCTIGGRGGSLERGFIVNTEENKEHNYTPTYKQTCIILQDLYTPTYRSSQQDRRDIPSSLLLHQCTLLQSGPCCPCFWRAFMTHLKTVFMAHIGWWRAFMVDFHLIPFIYDWLMLLLLLRKK